MHASLRQIDFGRGLPDRGTVVGEHQLLCMVEDELAMAGCEKRHADLCSGAELLSGSLGSFLEEQKFEGAWQGFIEQHSTEEKLKSAFHGWFDAFKTMKLFHYLAEKDSPRAEPAEVLGFFPAAWGDPRFSMSERLAFLRGSYIQA